ncbi:hypothetical protein H6S82_01240 [Planktothrix sp. FACHB-1355]|uniref:Uncharacterized protein n=1 Tax=Aerosakkonema funiforme FACHB-1375 TaxID=2949571 RepID=A0A926ZI74_9CYAN|nr:MULTISPECIES: hypothetical protein [Oscillatoriales]MBD2183399.1 hypothetical protein [Aerosakkonema funiforme FACHB-1375]MBD3557493.1 hypothetical protein [Planktothrix sp. FACHB-1355]
MRRAQKALLVDYEIPYFWTPYVLVGNWLSFWHYTLTVTAQLDGSLLAEE